ncbi:hypothetical protein HBN50_04250 [Halobacteriovorax sp. GB3]|uniref:hypothetical protein n=1 Tax=Halobacteriovorax sp. GB3 TaxID=2719615 RepID=UPI00235FF0AC|nr:hypothetical protein [Halobacteriovorax sp. GB3]MDD0852293.1 hypothetical protein [Halobacteriovorax sp. GB3]
MSAKSKIFRPIDEALMKQVEAFKSSQSYQKISDEMRLLSEQNQKAINYTLTILSTVLPLVIVGALALTNVFQKSRIETKEELLSSIKSYRKGKAEFDSFSRSLLSPYKVVTKEDLRKRINAFSSLRGIDNKKITISTFESTLPSGTITKVEATLVVSEFSLKDLKEFLTSILANEKMKVQSLNLNRNAKTETVQGSIEIIQYSKSGE